MGDAFGSEKAVKLILDQIKSPVQTFMMLSILKAKTEINPVTAGLPLCAQSMYAGIVYTAALCTQCSKKHKYHDHQ